MNVASPMHVYEVRPRKDKSGVDLISDMLPFGRLWYSEPNATSNAIGYAQFYSRAQTAVIRLYDSTGNLIETHEHAGDFREWRSADYKVKLTANSCIALCSSTKALSFSSARTTKRFP